MLFRSIRKKKLENNNGKPQYVVISDVTQDPFCPLPLSEWTFDLSDDQGVAQWESVLQLHLEKEVKDLYQLAKARNVYGHDGLMLSCGGAALQFLAHALEATGGRGTWISWRRPNYGAGKISHRDEKTNTMFDAAIRQTNVKVGSFLIFSFEIGLQLQRRRTSIRTLKSHSICLFIAV